MSQPFSVVESGFKFEVELEGNSLCRRFTLVSARGFNPSAIRVSGSGLADIMISEVSVAKETVTSTPISLSIVKLFSGTIDKKLGSMRMKKGDSLAFNLKNTGAAPRTVCIYIDGSEA